MSRSTDRLRHPRRDGGFALVEVVVAIGILGLLVAVVLPGLLVGIRAVDTARLTTQAKSLATAEMERLRNLPFHVAPEAGDFIDVLDRYFPGLQPPSRPPACENADGEYLPPTPSSSGYVTGSGRCDYEPTGAFYRTVRTAANDPDLAGFVVVVDTQFLSDAEQPTAVAPDSWWAPAVTGRDTPPASQIGVTVSVFRERGTTRSPVSSRTQISRTERVATRINGTVEVAALQVGTSTPVDVEVPVNASAGLVNLSSSLTYASVANASLSALSASIGTGDQARGATTNASSPPSTSRPAVGAGSGSLDSRGCALVCWGPSRVSSALLTSTDGLPNAGSPGSPLTTALGTGSGSALGVAAGDAAAQLPSLKLAGPLVDVSGEAVGTATGTACTVGTGGDNARVSASGWLRSEGTHGGSASVVEACGTARTTRIAVLPTTFAPGGVVRLRLNRAVARCLVTGSSHTAQATADYHAVVERWTPGGYVTVATVTPTGPDELAGVDLATTPVGGHGVLGDWIDSWSALVPDRVERRESDGSASVTVPGVVTLTTAPLRGTDGDPTAPEPLSTLSVSLGSVACSAEDAR